MAADRPEVAVLLTAYGRRAFVREALRSVPGRIEGGGPVQVILVADVERPEVEVEVRGRGGQVLHSPPGPLGGWIVEAAQHTSAPLLAFLDDDDRFAPTKLDAAAAAFRADPTLLYLHHGVTPIAGDGRVVAATVPRSPEVAWAPEERPPAAVAAAFREGIAFNDSSIVVRREVVETAPRLAEVQAGFGPHLYVAALRRGGRIVSWRTPLADYRLTDEGVAGWGASSRRARWRAWQRLAPRTVHDADLLLATLGADPRFGPLATALRVRRDRSLALLAGSGASLSRRQRLAAFAGLVRAWPTPDRSTGFLPLAAAHALGDPVAAGILRVLAGGAEVGAPASAPA